MVTKQIEYCKNCRRLTESMAYDFVENLEGAE